MLQMVGASATPIASGFGTCHPERVGSSQVRNNPRAAFTLVELLLALALLSVVAGIVVPAYLNHYQQNHAMDHAVATVMESLLTAKEMAVRSSTPHVCQYEVNSNLQIVFPVNDRNSIKAFRLPEGIRVESNGSSSSTDVRITFRADGSTDNCSFKVAGPTRTEVIAIERRLGIPRVTH